MKEDKNPEKETYYLWELLSTLEGASIVGIKLLPPHSFLIVIYWTSPPTRPMDQPLQWLEVGICGEDMRFKFKNEEREYSDMLNIPCALGRWCQCRFIPENQLNLLPDEDLHARRDKLLFGSNK